MLRWERDQNSVRDALRVPPLLPQCSGGSEIKTINTATVYARHCYHNAPVGARSKPDALHVGRTVAVTTMLRWERDQNDAAVAASDETQLPQCSGGSEIKTTSPMWTRRMRSYHNAPVGARSKRAWRLLCLAGEVTTMLRWERDQN